MHKVQLIKRFSNVLRQSWLRWSVCCQRSRKPLISGHLMMALFLIIGQQMPVQGLFSCEMITRVQSLLRDLTICLLANSHSFKTSFTAIRASSPNSLLKSLRSTPDINFIILKDAF